MVREINIYGNPILNQKCVPCELREKKSFLSEVTEDKSLVWTDEVIELVQDLKDTANSNADKTLGLAAPQIWWKDTPCPAVFVVRANQGTASNPVWIFTELINPKITTSGKSFISTEACLSVPNYSRPIKRESNVTVEYQLLSGPEVYRSKLFGKHDFNAIVIQHEYDHLIGKLIKK
jgi:peptide deformylase